MGVLKVRLPTGEWIEAVPQTSPGPDEVWVGAGPPDPVGQYEIWVDNTVNPPVLMFKSASGAWEPLPTGAEPNLDEVWVGAGPPDPVGTYELWVEPVVPPILRAKTATGLWIQVAPSLAAGTEIALQDEVWIGANPPDPRANHELWVDYDADPMVIKAKMPSGEWKVIAGSEEGNEVTVAHTDPYQTDPTSEDELWYDTGRGVPGTLYARVNDNWIAVTQYGGVAYEKQYNQAPNVGTQNAAARADHSHGTPAEEVAVGGAADDANDLWYDTTNDPGTLRVNIDGNWVDVATAGTGPGTPAPDEVWVGPVQPRDVTTELWFDPDAPVGGPSEKATVFGDGLGVTDIPNAQRVDVKAGEGIAVSPSEVSVRYEGSGVRETAARSDHGHTPATVPDEVWVGPVEPLAPEVELWADTDETIAVVDYDEVYVGPEDPRVLMPGSGFEVWHDTTAHLMKVWDNGVWLAYSYLPLGGAGGSPLVKNSATDGDMRWGGDINTGSIFPASGKIIQFPNATGPKIFTYAQTFGIGVESGEACIFGSSKVGFRQNASNGAYFGYVDANTGGGLIIDRDAGDARWGGQLQRSNSAFAALATKNLTGSYASVYNTPITYPSGNRRIKVTVQLKVVPGAEQHILIRCFGQETSFTKHNVLTDTIGPAIFVANATGTSQAVNVEVRSDTSNGSIAADGSSWVLVEDLGPR